MYETLKKLHDEIELILKNKDGDQQKLPPKKDEQVQELSQCSKKGCEQKVSYPTHTLCYDHWKEQQNKIEEA